MDRVSPESIQSPAGVAGRSILIGISPFAANPLLAESFHPNGQQRTAAYIQNNWRALTRSTDERSSLWDGKIDAEPVLYLPAGFAAPQKVLELRDKHAVQVRWLPRPIERMGDVRPKDLPAPGVLYLPNPYVVPGGRFNEMYGWDSYFAVLGLQSSGLHGLAKNVVDNLLFEVRYYGTVLNANRTYYLTRSQPPFLSAMIRSVCECESSFADRDAKAAWMRRAYPLAVKYYESWIEPRRIAGVTQLSRYLDLDDGPVPEMADDSTYYQDVIEWLLAYPIEDPGYLVQDLQNTRSDRSAQNGRNFFNPRTAVSQESASGFTLSEDFYRGDRAMRESGFDSSFRFGPFCGSTHHFAPVCLNSLLYRYERDMALLATEIGLKEEVVVWESLARQRSSAIQKFLWNTEEGLFLDYDFVQKKRSTYKYLSAYYPMWARLATPEQAERLRENLYLFERLGGMAMSARASGMQWDEPYGWAPCNWIAVEGLDAYGYSDDARRIAAAFVNTIDENFARDETIREKYDVVRRTSEIHLTAGYKENAIGFAWTNGVYLKMLKLLDANPASVRVRSDSRLSDLPA